MGGGDHLYYLINTLKTNIWCSKISVKSKAMYYWEQNLVFDSIQPPPSKKIEEKKKENKNPQVLHAN